MSRYIRNLIIALAVLAVLYGLNFVFGGRMISPYFSRILMLCGIAITMAVSLNLINGFTGQFSIGRQLAGQQLFGRADPGLHPSILAF